MNVPRIVIAGTQSGVGKTSITLGIVALLKRRGLRVQTFKVGPDYLDPTHLALASGRPCYNLDGWMMGEAYVRQLFARAVADADVAIVEGVMALFDGADPVSPEGSTAEIARWLDAPVLLVVNAQGLGGSVAATVHGYSSFDPKLHIAGVIANWCGSERHARWIEEALRGASLPPLVGALQRGVLPELPTRHLGLIRAEPGDLSRDTLDRLADAVESSVAIEKLLQVEALSGGAASVSQCAVPGADKSVAIGIARDEAFSFYYPDNLEALDQMGCELIPFSPLRDQSLPAGVRGLYFGGGYPEEHAAALASNGPMLSAIRCFAEEKVVYAECGGLMYLAQGIETLDGKRHPLLGLLPAWTRMRPRRQSLGYVEITLTRDCLWGHCGEQLRGHEFHYSELIGNPAWPTAYDVHYRRSDRVSHEGFQSRTILASYAHLHFASRPGAVQKFVSFMAGA
jgi:cobyrinic acid a,c-diamide synthase